MHSPPNTDVSELVKRLSAAESALEYSLGPGADAVVDSRGQAHLLRQAQVALQQSENRFRTLIENSADAIALVAADGIVLYNSPAVARVLGYAPAELLGHNFLSLFHPEDQARATEIFAELTATPRTAVTVALRYRHKNGAYHWLEGMGTNLLDQPGVNAVVLNYRDVTERKRSESTASRLAAIVESSDDAIIGKDLNGIITTWNPGAEKIFGYAASEMLATSINRLIPANRRDEEKRILGMISRGERVAHFETQRQCKDGRQIDVSVTTSPIIDAAGKVVGASKVARDITERKLAATALHEANTRYRLLFEQSPDGIVIIDLETGRLSDFNETAHRQLGYSREEFARLSISDIEAAETPEQTRARIASVTQKGRSDFETQHRTRQGGMRDIQVTAQFTEVAGHSVYHCVWRDITERKVGERQLREQNEILSNSHEGVMIVDLADKVTFWNHGAELMFGWTAAEALSRPPATLLGDDDIGLVPTLFTSVERDGFWNGELRMQARDGRKLIVDCRTTLVRDEAGRPRARLSFLADVTEKKLLEEKFLHAQRLESIGMLAAGIAHDLNNVLAPIVFAAPMLRESLSTPRDLKILDTLERSAGRGAGLVKQILGFAHSTTGELRLTQVKHLLRDIIGLIEETFPKSIQFEHHIPSDLWPVKGNATQIHQVLLNLCVNARDAMPQGGTLRITATNRRLDEKQARALPGALPGAWLVIEVTDTGTGIAPDVLAHIWDPFFTTKGVGKGTGLGLSTVNGIVASHHGFVTLDTQPGHGTTFRVFLPATEEQLTGDGATPAVAACVGHGEIILVVDDDAAVRESVAAILTKKNYRVLSACDGLEAVNQFTAHGVEIALVVTDVDMPHLGGAALARVLAQLRPDLRLLVISGLSGIETDGLQLDAAMKLTHAFLLKPFTQETLLATVHELLHPTPKT
jgi:PAS domain S-box-containing protein